MECRYLLQSHNFVCRTRKGNLCYYLSAVSATRVRSLERDRQQKSKHIMSHRVNELRGVKLVKFHDCWRTWGNSRRGARWVGSENGR